MTSLVNAVLKRRDDIENWTSLLTNEVEMEIPFKIRLDTCSESAFGEFFEEMKRLTGLQFIVIQTQIGTPKFLWGRDYKCKYWSGTIG